MRRKNSLLVVSMAVNSIVLGSVSLALGQSTGTTGSTNTTASTSSAAANQTPIGRVTANFGVASIQSAAGNRTGELHTLINNDDRIVTDGGGMSLLLASRIVLKIDANSSLVVREGTGKTDLVLEYGSVQVFVGKRPADYGTVTLQDAHAKVDAMDGVFLASYDPVAKDGYYACEHSTVTLTADDGKPMKLTADEQAFVDAGKLRSSGTLDRVAYADRKKSLERLGQSALAQSSQTFRMRSRTFDTESALSQLSAAGWIKREDLVAKVAKPAAVSKKKTDSTAAADESVAATDEKNETTATGTTAVAAVPTQTKSQTPEPAEVPVTPSGPVASAPVSSTDAVTLDATIGSTPEVTTVANATQTPAQSMVPPKSDLGLSTPTATSSGNGGVTLAPDPVIAQDSGSHGGHGHGPKVNLPPKADLGLGTANSTATPIDLGVGSATKSPNTPVASSEGSGGNSVPSVSSGTKGGLTLGSSGTPTVTIDIPSVADIGTPSGTTPAASASSGGPKVNLPKVDSSGKGSGTPKGGDVDVAVTRAVAPPVSANLPPVATGGVPAAPTPGISIPKLDLPTLPKADIGIGDVKDIGGTGTAAVPTLPKVETPVVGSVPKLDIPSVATTPKVTLPTAADVTLTPPATATPSDPTAVVPAVKPDVATPDLGAPKDATTPGATPALPTPGDVGVVPTVGADGKPVVAPPTATPPTVDKPQTENAADKTPGKGGGKTKGGKGK